MAQHAVHPRMITTGDHDRAAHVNLLFQLYRARRNGILTVRSGQHFRQLYIVAGSPAWYSSNVEDEGLAASLVAAGLVTASQMDWLRNKLSPGEQLGQVLVASGTLTRERLQVHEQMQVEQGYTAALAWRKGTWSFESCQEDLSDRLDPALQMPIQPMRVLWRGIKRHVPMDESLRTISDPTAGDLLPGDDLEAVFPSLEVDAMFTNLPAEIGERTRVESLFRVIADRSGDLAKLLWMMEKIGLLVREGQPNEDLLEAMAWIHTRDTSTLELVTFEELDSGSDLQIMDHEETSSLDGLGQKTLSEEPPQWGDPFLGSSDDELTDVVLTRIVETDLADTPERYILVIDTDAGPADEIYRRFEHHGIEIRTAADPSDGYQMSREAAPALILLNGDLPDGYTACDLFKGDSFLRQVPMVLMCSGMADARMVSHWFEETAADLYIRKPVAGAFMLRYLRGLESRWAADAECRLLRLRLQDVAKEFVDLRCSHTDVAGLEVQYQEQSQELEAATSEREDLQKALDLIHREKDQEQQDSRRALDELGKELDEAKQRAEEAVQRAEEAEASTEEARQAAEQEAAEKIAAVEVRVEEAERKLTEADARAGEFLLEAQQAAEQKVAEAEARAQEAALLAEGMAEQLQDAEARADDAESQAEATQQAVEEAQGRTTEAEQQADDATAAADEARALSTEAVQQVEIAARELSEAERARDEAEARIEEAVAKAEQAADEAAAMAEELGPLRKELEELQLAEQALRVDAEKTQEYIETLQEQKTQVDTKAAEANAQLAQLRMEDDFRQSEAQEAQDRATQLEEALQNVRAELELAREEAAVVLKRAEDSEREVHRVREGIGSLSDIAEKRQEKIEAADKAALAQASTIEALQEELAASQTLAGELEEARAEIKGQNQRVQDLEQAGRDTSAQINDLTDQLVAQTDLTEEQQQATKAAIDAREELTGEITQLQQRLEELESASNEAGATIEGLQQELAVSQVSADDLKEATAEIERQKQLVQDLEQEGGDTSTQIVQLNEQLKAQTNQARERQTEALDTIEALREELAVSRNLADELEEERLKSVAEAARLTAEMEARVEVDESQEIVLDSADPGDPTELEALREEMQQRDKLIEELTETRENERRKAKQLEETLAETRERLDTLQTELERTSSDTQEDTQDLNLPWAELEMLLASVQKLSMNSVDGVTRWDELESRVNKGVATLLAVAATEPELQDVVNPVLQELMEALQTGRNVVEETRGTLEQQSDAVQILTEALDHADED